MAGLPNVLPVGAEQPAETELVPEPGMKPEMHGGCPFFNNGKCMVLNENVKDLGKQDAEGYDEAADDSDLSEF